MSSSSLSRLSLSSHSLNNNNLIFNEDLEDLEGLEGDSFDMDQQQFSGSGLGGGSGLNGLGGGEDDTTQLLGMIMPSAIGSSSMRASGKSTVTSTTTINQQVVPPIIEASYSYGGTMGTFTANPTSNPAIVSPSSPTHDPTPSTQIPESYSTYEKDSEIDFTTGGWTTEQIKRWRELREERDGLRFMNEGLEGLDRDLRGVQGGLERFEATIATSHALLDLYVTLSSQAEHTQQLLLDGQWEGVTKDIQILAAREAEQTKIAQEAQEAQEREEMERERERERKELEALKKASAPPPSTSTRGSTRSRPRGLTSTSRGGSTRPPPPTTSQPNNSISSSTSSSTHGQSGIGRGGPPSTRGTVTGVRGVRGIRSRVLVRGTGVAGGRGGTVTGIGGTS